MSDEDERPRECVCERPILVDEGVFRMGIRCVKCGKDYEGLHSFKPVR